LELERTPHPGTPGGPRSSGPSGPSEAPGTGENT
jgi:hypothetical protein